MGLAGLLALGGCRSSGSSGAPSEQSAEAGAPSAPVAASARAAERCALRAADLPGRIYFVSERDGNLEVYAIDPDGGGPVRLTRNDHADYLAAPPADRATLLLVRTVDRPGGSHVEQLFLLRPSGVAPARAIGPASFRVRNPSWLPDGRSVVFEADLHGFRDLYRLELGTEQLERLTKTERGSFEPDVDPRGRLVAFASSRDGHAQIYTMDLQSRREQRLTWSPEDDASPRWSPDGSQIAFLRSRRGITQTYLMGADGSRPRPLRTAAAERGGRSERDIAWSPDGGHVALVEQQPGRANVVIVRIRDGSETARTEGAWVDEQPAWSPDGRYLAFVSNREGNAELYAMRRDGGCTSRLTSSEQADWLPRWTAR